MSARRIIRPSLRGHRLSTIIFVTLGIILAAAATLMSVFYGGDVFFSGQVKAQAATLENAAQNIQAAMTGRQYHGNRDMPNTLEDLVTSPGHTRWITSLPDISVAQAGPQKLMAEGNVRMYAVPGVPEKVCIRINQDYSGDGALIPNGRGPQSRGCFRDAAGDLVFYSVIGQRH